MAIHQAFPKLLQSLTPELRSTTIKRSESLLLRIVRANLNTQYASRTPSLTKFRDAISPHGSGSGGALVENFRRRVPLSDYESYKPFMAAFDKQPCKEAEVKNLLAPGLPLFLAVSSTTSGRAPKTFPRYLRPMVIRPFAESPGPMALVISYSYKGVMEVECETGRILKKIPASTISSGTTRAMLGWSNIDEDENRMSSIMPGHVAPWAASMIKHHRSFLTAHALFTLACRDLGSISTTLSTILFDLVRVIDEEWDILLSSVKNGRVPDLSGAREIIPHLQANFHANPDRAAELGNIGPPFSREGWAALVWPKLKMTTFVCSGPFATVLPKLKRVIGPTIGICTPGYGSSESFIAVPHRPDDHNTFVLRSDDVVEFLDVTAKDSHENIRQAWELEVGKEYEIVLTTNDGLWRYQLSDVVNIVGFDANDGSPVFVFSYRRNAGIRLISMSMTDAHLMPAIQALSSDIMRINEFTTVLDDRQSTRTVGYIVEPAGALGPNAHLSPAKLAEGLAAVNTAFRDELKTAAARHPTVRIVRPGTFTEYRQWRAEKMNVGPGQIKVPVVMLDPVSIAWTLERVIAEL